MIGLHDRPNKTPPAGIVIIKPKEIDDITSSAVNDKLKEWENFYNYHIPHAGLGGQTPYESLREKTGLTV